MSNRETRISTTFFLAWVLSLLVGTRAARGGRPFGGDDGGFVPPNKITSLARETE